MFGLFDEAAAARETAMWRAHMQAIRDAVLAAPALDLMSKCPKCGGGMLPKYQKAFTKFGVTVPDRVLMTCACGFAKDMRPLDAQ